MATFPVNVFKFSLLCSSLFFVTMVSSYQFHVGGERGWTKPTGNESETYNHWAAMNRFHVGDTIYFKYTRDSVLVVNPKDYKNCKTSNPISKYENGNTVFQLDHSGFFYFISGEPNNCKAGQKLIIDVMHVAEVETEPPESAAPSPSAGGGAGGGSQGGGSRDSDDWGPPGLELNSTTKLSVASYFVTALGGVLIILYMLMN